MSPKKEEYTPEELERIRQARNAYQREYYRNNREKCLEISKRSRQKRREKIKEYQNEYWLRKAMGDEYVVNRKNVMIEKELIIHYKPKRISIIAETEKEINERVVQEVKKTKRAIESVELRDMIETLEMVEGE